MAADEGGKGDRYEVTLFRSRVLKSLTMPPFKDNAGFANRTL